MRRTLAQSLLAATAGCLVTAQPPLGSGSSGTSGGSTGGTSGAGTCQLTAAATLYSNECNPAETTTFCLFTQNTGF